MISFDELQKVEIKIGKIRSAEKVEGADKLLKLVVSFGEEERQVVAGIATSYEPEEIIGKKSVFITNLEPAKIRGVESQAMIMVAEDKENLILLVPEKDVPEGTKVR